KPPKKQSFPRCYVSHVNRLSFQKNRWHAFNWCFPHDSESRRDRTDRQELAHPDRGPEAGQESRRSGSSLRLSGLAGIDKPEAQAKSFSKSWNDLRLRFRLVIDKLNGSIAVGRTGLC